MQLVYEEFGDTQKSPLIILHGFFASARNWRVIAEKLANNYHVYVVDQRNHGASFHDIEMNYEIMADDVLHFIWQHNLNKVSILGHSMGGKVAMWFALNHGDYIDKLIIADIAPVSYTHSFDKTMNVLKALPLAELKNRKQAEEFLAHDIPELSYRQFLLQNLILEYGEYRWRIDLDIFAKNAHYIVAFPETYSVTPFLNKVLFIAGAESQYVKQGQFESLFPNGQLEIIANAGHWLHVQQPEAFILAVTNFLEQKHDGI